MRRKKVADTLPALPRRLVLKKGESAGSAALLTLLRQIALSNRCKQT